MYIACSNRYDLNHRGGMEIDHGLAPEAMVGRATTAPVETVINSYNQTLRHMAVPPWFGGIFFHRDISSPDLNDVILSAESQTCICIFHQFSPGTSIFSNRWKGHVIPICCRRPGDIHKEPGHQQPW